MATVSLNQIRKSFGTTDVIKGVDLEIADRDFCVFVGPSGCGKSTLLRMIAGLEEISDGDLLINGERANDVPPAERGLAMVFQTYALYPHIDRRRQYGLLVAAGRREQEGALAEDRRRGARPPARAAFEAQAQGAVGRAAAAGRHRPGDRPPAEGLSLRRALVQPRRRPAGADAHRARPPARGPEGDHDLRHPRSGRGHDHGRQDRGPARWHRRAGGHAARALPPSAQPVRRRLHRQPEDELPRGQGEGCQR